MRGLNYIKWFIFIITLVGCKSRKNTSTAVWGQRQTETQVEGNTSGVELLSRDSISRYWSFTSDSSFVFHPWIGLWGHSGRLEYLERNTTQIMAGQWLSSYDSTRAAYSEETNSTRASQTLYLLSNWFYLLAVAPIAIGVYCFWRKRF
ncbi:hypothetical protein [Sphingobacterium paucimobilis]|nr:hypothetical protein [Sphingobacterium paucimobilis]